MEFHLTGRVLTRARRLPVGDVMVSFFDHDPDAPDLGQAASRFAAALPDAPAGDTDAGLFGQVIGTVLTGPDGSFELTYEAGEVGQGQEPRADLIVAVFAPLTSTRDGHAPPPPGERLLHFSRYPWMNAGTQEAMLILLEEARLTELGLLPAEPDPAQAEPVDERLKREYAEHKQRQERYRQALRDTAGVEFEAAKARQDRARRAARSVTNVRRAPRQESAAEDDSTRDVGDLIIPDVYEAEERHEISAAMTVEQFQQGVSRLVTHQPPGTFVLEIHEAELQDAECGLLKATNGGVRRITRRTLRELAADVRRSRGDTTGDSDGAGGGGVTGGVAVDIDLPLDTLDSITTYGSEPWDIVADALEVTPDASPHRAIFDADLTNPGFAVAEVQVQIPSSGFSGVDDHATVGFGPAADDNGGPVGGIRGDGAVILQWSGDTSLAEAPFTLPPAGTWVTLRLERTGAHINVSVDGVRHIEFTHSAEDLGPRIRAQLNASSASGATFRFRNMRVTSVSIGHGEGGGGIGGTSALVTAEPSDIQELILRLIEQQIRDLGRAIPTKDELERSSIERIRDELDSAVFGHGPADTTAYHDFHVLQLAYPHVWAELFDDDVKERVKDLYWAAEEVTEAVGLDPVSAQEIGSLDRFIEEMAGLSAAAETAMRTSMPEVLGRYFPEVAAGWVYLTEPERQQFIEAMYHEDDAPNDAQGWDRFPIWAQVRGMSMHDAVVYAMEHGGGGYEFLYWQSLNRVHALSASKNWDLLRESAATPFPRLRRNLEDLGRMQIEPYSFEYYAENSINFGIITTYRQSWVPGPHQAGGLAGTVTLTAGETRKLQTKQSIKTTRSTKEMERAQWTRAGESTQTARESAEIVRKAEASTNFKLSTQGTVNLGIGSFTATSEFAADQSTFSQDTKKDFREAVVKASHEYRNERSLEISTGEEILAEATTTTEISNPNDEVPVTYLFYELERQYEVMEKIHALQPVILVAQPVPKPNEITEAWITRDEWILRRAMLDDMFISAFDQMHSFASDEVAMAVVKANWEAQVRVVERLEGHHTHFTNVRQSLREELLKVKESEMRAEAFSGSFGFLAQLGRELAPFDPVGANLETLRVQRQLLEDQMEWIEAELTRAAEKLASAREALNTATREYRGALEERTQQRARLDQLKLHIKDNILHFMQVKWAHEPTDQRYHRLHNVEVEIPGARWQSTRSGGGTGRLGERVGSSYAGWRLVPDFDNPQKRPLHEVADLDQPLGFKGNYMIFPLKICTHITDFMMLQYLDGYLGLRDPDELSEFDIDELIEYRDALAEDDHEARSVVTTVIADRLSNRRTREGTIVVPTGHLYIEALVGSHTLLEPFKLAHRAYDAANAAEKVHLSKMERLRYAKRLAAETPLLGDPEVDRHVVVDDSLGGVIDDGT